MNLNLDSNTLLTKFNIQDRSIYMKILWKQNESDLFHIKIFEGGDSWSGRYSNEFAEKYREECVHETKTEYASNVRLFLSGNSDQCAFDFVPIAGDRDARTFIWKKKLSSSATRLHGTVPVHRDEIPESKDSLIDYLLTENKGLHLILADLNRTTDTLTSELDKCKLEMEKFVELKSSLESSLYGKFLQLLNAKKRRIQLLEESLQKFDKPEHNVNSD